MDNIFTFVLLLIALNLGIWVRFKNESRWMQLFVYSVGNLFMISLFIKSILN